jgi:multidrug resistance efflux pump
MTMKKPKLGTRMLTTGAVVTVAVIALAFLYLRFVRRPWTRDAQVTANIIMVTPRVTGLVVKIGVADNQSANAGAVLFEIDPDDYELAVASARASLEQARQQVAALEAAIVAAEAGVREAQAGITTARANVDSARAQVAAAQGQVSGGQAGLRSAQAAIDKAKASLEESIRQRDRAQKLAKDGAGSVATAESKAAAVEAAQATLDGSHAGLSEAEATLAQARAALQQRQAGLASAELDLERTVVRAPSDGYVTNLTVDIGDYASPGTPLLAFVDSASFRVQGFFRETQLRHIEPGDRAVVTLMSHRDKPIEGVVDSIGWAINPPNIATTEGTGGLVPQIQPSFDWIRLAQRVPVRVKLGEIPEGVQLVSGTTASVVIKPEN